MRSLSCCLCCCLAYDDLSARSITCCEGALSFCLNPSIFQILFGKASSLVLGTSVYQYVDHPSTITHQTDKMSGKHIDKLLMPPPPRSGPNSSGHSSESSVILSHAPSNSTNSLDKFSTRTKLQAKRIAGEFCWLCGTHPYMFPTPSRSKTRK